MKFKEGNKVMFNRKNPPKDANKTGGYRGLYWNDKMTEYFNKSKGKTLRIVFISNSLNSKRKNENTITLKDIPWTWWARDFKLVK